MTPPLDAATPAPLSASSALPAPSGWRLPSWALPPAGAPVAGWHVSPLVDTLAYHVSWAWILVPLAFAGERHPKDYLTLWAIGITASFVHRHFTMPYVYLDPQVFRAHVTRFTLFVWWLTLGGLATPWLTKGTIPAGALGAIDAAVGLSALVVVVTTVRADRRGVSLSWPALVTLALPMTALVVAGISGLYLSAHAFVAPLLLVGFTAGAVVVARAARGTDAHRSSVIAAWSAGAVALVGLALSFTVSAPLTSSPLATQPFIGAVAVFAAVWNIWHTLMQKFGILRVYAAKQVDVPAAERTPAWIDRLFLFSWIPFLLFWVVPTQRETLHMLSKTMRPQADAAVDFFARAQPFVLPPALVLIVVAAVLFVRAEWRSSRLTSVPRLSMAVSMTALHACFLFMSPLKVYIAYGFSHALEYMIFVWAFQRRRYAQPLPHRPLLQRIMKHPVFFYAAFIAVVGGVFFYIDFGRKFGLYDEKLTLLGFSAKSWLFAWAVWHSMAHFYFDGFLWKMRLQSVRSNL